MHRARDIQMTSDYYAIPRHVESIQDCLFYHTIDLPGYGPQQGHWDLRAGVSDYLGHVPLRGKRVLEVGTANGLLCFEMEKMGAEVVGYDLSDKDDGDLTPFGGRPNEERLAASREQVRRLNNAWWLAHRLMKSRAKVVYGSVYSIPEEIGPFHVSTFGCILLHLRDPFLALQKAAVITTETVIVTEPMPRYMNLLETPLRALAPLLPKKVYDRFMRCMRFLPDSRKPECRDTWYTWWQLPPDLVTEFLKVLGFPETKVTYHTQTFMGRPQTMFTAVGRKP